MLGVCVEMIILMPNTSNQDCFLFGEVEVQNVRQRSKQKTVIQENMAMLVK